MHLNDLSTFIGIVLLVYTVKVTRCQIINRPPQFVPGSGDMSRFSLSENTPVGSPIYQLRGADPEGGALRYSISGPVFSVDRDTGVVRLRQKLDRETSDLVEVIISITDDGVLGTEPNTVSLRREVPIRDYNDNSPVFIGRPYTTSISESTSLQSIIEILPEIIVTDRDEGQNADITLSCFDDSEKDADVCETFDVRTEKYAEGNFTAVITLLKALDFETRPSYVLTLLARDGASTNPLSAYATISINVVDVQDQPPVFVNAPYSATIAENTPEDTSVLSIAAADGDTGNPRPVVLSIENEPKGHFKLETIGRIGDGEAVLYTTGIPIDREDPDILQNGGVYSFTVKATELINNELPGDVAYTQVTIVLTDVDDHLPEFNEPSFEISIPENLEQDTPLPGLSIYVVDQDLGANSRYNLSLRNVYNAKNVFAVSPTQGEGRTPIVVKVIDSTKLDYDVADVNLRNLTFDLIASVNGMDLAMSRINVNLQDSNDNSPIFTNGSYHVRVEENSIVGTKIADNIMATDKDSGVYGKIAYVLKGFGSDNFYTDTESGGLFVKKNLDYEQQKSYSLTIVAVDSGGRETNANLYVDIVDLNDNFPTFESLEYTRTIREGTTEFEPQFFVRATDDDGPSQGDGRVKYSIESENSISGHVFAVDEQTGEITILEPVNSMDTERGQYELSIGVTDYGVPPLKNTTRVQIRVGISGNQRPIFKGHFSTVGKGDIPGPPRFTVTIPEIAKFGYNVTTVTASDPDGLDALLTYRIVGSNDNFVINERTGLITVSSVARLDRDTNPDHYAVVINAVDAGFPIPETATATLYVNIKDVNDKPPKFTKSAYTAYISERTGIDGEVLRVSATDTDLDSKLKYSLIEPIKAASKTGTQLSSTVPFDYTDAFKIDENNGAISVQNTLNHDLAAVIILTVKAVDIMAAYNKDHQFATVEVTIYVQSFKDTHPIFKNKGWSSNNPILNFKVKEEMPIGSTLFTLVAEDPVSKHKIQSFQIIEPDPLGVFGIHDRTGEIQLKNRLDYEELDTTSIQFSVMARSNDGRATTTRINVTVENVNDNRPVFEQKLYKATILEGTTYPTKVITVYATDSDVVLTELDKHIGYNVISYSLSGPGSEYFIINNKTGLIQIAANQTLDREKQSVVRLLVTAEDSPGKPTETRKSTSEVIVKILDINDNAPQFLHPSYSAVIPENSKVSTFVANVTASDPDEGLGGEIRYEFLDEGDANGLLKINPVSGEVRTRVSLTGKGRSEPYEFVIRAQDSGDQIPKQKTLHSDVTFTVFIGDVSANDGIPFFIAPKIGQVANISENATIGSPVFQVMARDYDSPSSPSGHLSYRIQDDIEDANSFRIDENTGLIITVRSLDRETKSSYNIIVEVSDHGQPPQAATRVLRINILDVDDHKPRFIREVNSQPLEMELFEEQSAGTVVGNLTAIDEDINENGAIDYVIIDGNEEDIFKITRNADNAAILTTQQRLDREVTDSYLLTVKCFKLGSHGRYHFGNTYNPNDVSEIQVVVRVIDIDDHLPEYAVKNPAVGIRSNVPIDEIVLSVKATDRDPDALPIMYRIKDITFVPQFYKRENISMEMLSDLFSLDNVTGEVKTARSMADFVDGYFEMIVRANNSASSKRYADNKVKVFVIRDKSLLRFVFTRPASEVEGIVSEFAEKVQSELRSSELELYILDTQVLTKTDHSLDFSSTSSCFQLSRHGSALSPLEMQTIMDSDDVRQRLLETYSKYSVSVVDSCSVRRNVAVSSFVKSPGAWLVILAIFIGLLALIATCTACCLTKRYKKQSRRLIPARPPPPPESYGPGGPVLYAEPIYGQM